MTTNDQAAMNEQLTQLRLNGLSIDGENRYKQDLIDAIIGAMMFGAQGANPPPAGHWLEQFYVIGREEREARAALATQPAAGEPVYQWNAGAAWIESSERGIRIAKENGHQTRVLWTAPPAAAPVAAGEPVAWADNIALGRIASGRSVVTLSNVETVEYSIPLFMVAPPAAAHGDDAVLNLVPGLQWAIDYCNAMQRQGNDRMLVEVIRKRLENVRDNQPTAMRAQEAKP